jgi:hypothetical protein
MEDFTLHFDEANILKSTPNLVKLFIRADAPSAKDSLKKRLPREYLPMLNRFGSYTLEALMIHVLGLVFHCIRSFER